MGADSCAECGAALSGGSSSTPAACPWCGFRVQSGGSLEAEIGASPNATPAAVGNVETVRPAPGGAPSASEAGALEEGASSSQSSRFLTGFGPAVARSGPSSVDSDGARPAPGLGASLPISTILSIVSPVGGAWLGYVLARDYFTAHAPGSGGEWSGLGALYVLGISALYGGGIFVLGCIVGIAFALPSKGSKSSDESGGHEAQ